MKNLLLVFFIAVSIVADSQKVNPSLLKNTWPAFWITAPDAPAKSYGVYYFRKKISLSERPCVYRAAASFGA